MNRRSIVLYVCVDIHVKPCVPQVVGQFEPKFRVAGVEVLRAPGIRNVWGFTTFDPSHPD